MARSGLMDIGAYSFEEFRQLAENFHGYAAPGLLLGAYMVEKAKKELPEGTLFEAVVESAKCLPDAVQLLTLCSTGNQRLKIHNLGRYAVSLFDKYTGAGVRVSLNVDELAKWPELYAWFFKQKPKKEQDSAKLEKEIRTAGDSVCNIRPVRVKKRFIGQKHMASIGICQICGEAYPTDDGPICRGCQGEAPYIQSEVEPINAECEEDGERRLKIVPLEQAVGQIAAHDMTRIEPGIFKGPEFRAGQRISPGDVCRLQSMGRFHVAVLEKNSLEGSSGSSVHENVAANAFARRMAGEGIIYDPDPREGKIDFKAAIDGLYCVNEKKLKLFNLVPHVMAASRRNATLVQKGDALAGTRAIPLFLEKGNFEKALATLDGAPLFKVLPLRKAKIGILVTGTEVFKGIIEDRFIPIITAKALNLGSEIIASAIVPDDKKAIAQAFEKMRNQGIDMLVTTGGLSVDPDDVTRQAIVDLGLEQSVHGVPVLPGAMSLVGKIRSGDKEIQVMGVPACALYFRTTFLDLIFPRLLAGIDFTRTDAAEMGSGGYCLSCKTCSWPKCGFGK